MWVEIALHVYYIWLSTNKWTLKWNKHIRTTWQQWKCAYSNISTQSVTNWLFRPFLFNERSRDCFTGIWEGYHLTSFKKKQHCCSYFRDLNMCPVGNILWSERWQNWVCSQENWTYITEGLLSLGHSLQLRAVSVRVEQRLVFIPVLSVTFLNST